MAKFDRQYSLFVQEDYTMQLLGDGISAPRLLTSVDEGFIHIELPFTMEFDVAKNIMGSSNNTTIRVLNLSEHRRKKIFKPQYNFAASKQILLKAGYAGTLPVIFNGFISEAFSVREDVNFVTEMSCHDGGFAFANGVSALSFKDGTPVKEVISELVSNLIGVEPGAIGDSYTGSIARGNTYSGSTTDILHQITGGGFFIDNGKANCLGDNECLEGSINVINSDSGLLGTPKITGPVGITFDMVFEPRLLIGQRIQLVSSTARDFNGIYKIIGLHHRGTISSAVCGNAITTVELLNTLNVLSVVSQ